MPKKLQPADLEKIIQPLPPKERLALREQDLTRDWLAASIERCKRLMKRDLWVGLPWFAAYTAALFGTGIGALSIGIFAAGMAYFTWTIFTTGSYGLNRKRVAAYEALLQKIEG